MTARKKSLETGSLCLQDKLFFRSVSWTHQIKSLVLAGLYSQVVVSIDLTVYVTNYCILPEALDSLLLAYIVSIIVYAREMHYLKKDFFCCIQVLHTLMKDCLNAADSKKKASIAFPAIGTGNLGFPRDVVATEMFTAVSKFAESKQFSSIQDVRFIVYQKDFSTIQV